MENTIAKVRLLILSMILIKDNQILRHQPVVLAIVMISDTLIKTLHFLIKLPLKISRMNFKMVLTKRKIYKLARTF
jgi:hypothetical protein